MFLHIDCLNEGQTFGYLQTLNSCIKMRAVDIYRHSRVDALVHNTRNARLEKQSFSGMDLSIQGLTIDCLWSGMQIYHGFSIDTTEDEK